MFRAMISSTLDMLGDTPGCPVEMLMAAVDEKVDHFFTQSLRLDVLPCNGSGFRAHEDEGQRGAAGG